MKALAEYVMRGRVQALWVAVLTAGTLMFSWLSAAIIALVVLRKGMTEGSYILMWAVLPAGAILFMGEIGPLGMLLGTSVLAGVLRWTMSWSYTLLAAVAVGLLTGLLLMTLGAGYLATIADIFRQFIEQFQQQLSEQGEQVSIQAPSITQIAGLLAMMNAVSSVLCLILARWWQSLLYNPKGFGEEFRALRLTPPVTLVLIVLGLVASTLGFEYRAWAMIFAIPMVFAAFALLHWAVNKRQMSGQWLFVAYMLWFFADLVKAGLVLLAVADSWIDFRRRGDKRTDLK